MAAKHFTAHYSKAALVLLAMLVLVSNSLAASQEEDRWRQQFNITSKADDFKEESRHQHISIVTTIEEQLFSFRSNYQDQVSIVELPLTFTDRKLEEAWRQLIPLESLDYVHKYCVQKHRPPLVALKRPSQAAASCISSCSSSLSSIISRPEQTKNYIISYINGAAQTRLNACNNKFDSYSRNYSECVRREINITNYEIFDRRKLFDKQLEESKCAATQRLRDAADCVFRFTYPTAEIIGYTNKLIENCINGTLEWLQQYPQLPCDNCTTTPPPSYGCIHRIEFYAGDGIFSNTTIYNPFKEYKGAQCVNVEFNYAV